MSVHNAIKASGSGERLADTDELIDAGASKGAQIIGSLTVDEKYTTDER